MISELELKQNIETVNNNIALALQKSGRKAEELTIVAATKTQPIEQIKKLFELTDIKIAGENRVQEFCEKFEDGIDWQIIGQLQTNKVKYCVGKVSLIQSVDRISLLAEIDRLSKSRSIITNVLVEVNVGGEEAKGGLKPAEVSDFIKRAEEYQNIVIKGLMSVMPNEKNMAKLASYYLQLYKIYDNMLSMRTQNADYCYLSAGMSEDYPLAIECGANMLRLGRAFFGARV
jgi:pyridoxal phosphate enzyme (YggS family)